MSNQNQNYFYVKYLNKLLKVIPPFQYNEAIIIASLYETQYSNYLQNLTMTAPNQDNQNHTIPKTYPFQEKIIVDCSQYILRDGNNTRQSIFNIQYLYGSMNSVKILLPIQYTNTHNFQLRITNIIKKFCRTFGSSFLPRKKFPLEQDALIKSVGLLVIDGNADDQIYQRLQNIQKDRAFECDEMDMMIQILREIAYKRKIIIHYPQCTGIRENSMRVLEKMEGTALSIEARGTMLSLHLGQSTIQESGREAFFDENIEEFRKFSVKIISSFLKDNIENFFDEEKRSATINQMEKMVQKVSLQNYLKPIPTTKQEKKDKFHILSSIQTLEIIYELDMKEEEEDKGTLFCNFLKKLCETKIIIEGRLENSKVYLFACFLEIIFKIFGFPKLMTEFSLINHEIKDHLVYFFQSILNKLCENIYKIYQYRNEKPQIINQLVVKKIQNFLTVIENSEMTNKYERLKEAQKFLQKYFARFYFFLNVKMYNSKFCRISEVYKFCLTCEKYLKKTRNQLDNDEEPFEFNQRLMKIYLMLGEILYQRKELLLAKECFQGAKSFQHYNNVVQELIKSEKNRKELDLEKIIAFYNELGFPEEGRMLCYLWIEKSENKDEFMKASRILQRLKDSKQTRPIHEEFLQKLAFKRLQFLSSETMAKIEDCYYLIGNDY